MTPSMFGNMAGVIAAIQLAMGQLVPPPDVQPSIWAESNINIPVGNAVPGPINFDNAPYQRGMIDVIKEDGIRRVDYMTGAQLGKTTVQQCITGYFISHEPRSQIFAQPSQGDVQTFLETKLQPMIDANKSISKLLAKPRGRKGVNNSRLKSYPGGWLMFSWAGSPKTARGRSAPVVHLDEVDGMPPTKEGDFPELLAQRAGTFGDQALITRSSTPTIKGTSRIEAGFLAGDQRRFYVPCPDCGEAQHLKWAQIIWDGRQSTSFEDFELDKGGEHDPTSARYVCEHCGSLWDDGMRIAAIRGAERAGHGWKAAKPFKGHASFHAPEWLSTFRRLRDIVQSYLDKLAVDDLQSFVNVSAAETFEERGEKGDPDGLMARAEEYPAQVPMGGLVLTAGVDMQQDRLEVEIVAWGHGEESWSIDYQVLWGDPDQDEVWDDLDDLLLHTTWKHESGADLKVLGAGFDTGGTGGNTQSAYEQLRARRSRRIFAMKGVGGWDKPIVSAPSRKQSGKSKRKVDLYNVGSDWGKLTVMRRLALERVGGGYCHFPSDREAEWYQQLTAEKMVTRYVKGFAVREWHKIRDRNEGLDCRVYALAALKILNPSFRAHERRLLGAQAGTLERRAQEPPAAANDQTPPPANDAAEIPQEEAPKTKAQSRREIRPRRIFKPAKSGGARGHR